MRQLIVTKGERFDIETVRPKIECIADAFDRYLDEYRPKTTRTMHGVMGPVPMILDGARVRKEDAKTLVGRAVRAHEMNENNRGYLSPSALEALEAGTQDLLTLYSEVPITAVPKVTERVRYIVYYTRRKKAIEWLEQKRGEFIKFLRERYADETALTTAWGEESLKFDDVRFPSRKNQSFKQANNAKKGDITNFWESINMEPIIAEEEDDNE